MQHDIILYDLSPTGTTFGTELGFSSFDFNEIIGVFHVYSKKKRPHDIKCKRKKLTGTATNSTSIKDCNILSATSKKKCSGFLET
jgi:hypothetical protein